MTCYINYSKSYLVKIIKTLQEEKEVLESKLKDSQAMIKQQNSIIAEKNRLIKIKKETNEDTKRMDWLCDQAAHPNDLRAAISHAMERSK